ncbi:MAG: TonB-dependent receptor [Deltaproteobacteria bacterium]|nr:TonB-dependent receptor [Deltaproteobacteria bacterium]
MMNRLIGCLVIFIALILPGFSQAEDEKKDETSETTMEEVVVTATRQAEKISSVPANVSVITENDIKNSTARDIPDLLRTQAGILVNDIAGNQRNYTVDLRGFGETGLLNTLVLVDGRRVNNPDLSGSDWTLISLNRVKRIEVIRGGRGSVLYGDNASGGVINIITKEGKEFKTDAEIAGGSYSTFRGNASIGGSSNNLSYDISGSYLNSDGYRDNSDTKAGDIGADLGYYVGDRMKVSLSGGYHKDDTGLPGAIKKSDFEQGVSRTDTLHPDDFADVEDYYVKLAPEIFFLNDSLFKIDFSFRNRSSLFFSSFSGGTYEGDTDIETIALSPQFIFKEKIKGFNNSLTFGFDFENAAEDITNTTMYLGYPDVGIFELEKENYGFYVHDEIYLLDNLAISGGYRYDKAKFKFKPSTPDSTEMSENLYTAGINYNFYKKSYAYFSFSHSFRYPVLDELFNFYTNTINTDLIPQTSDDYELGVRYYFTPSLFANVNLFYIDTKDEILYDPASGYFGANVNLDGKTRRDGVEVVLSKVYEKVTLSGSYTYTDAEIIGGSYDGSKFPNVARHKATLDTLFSLGYGFSLNVNGFWVGERPFVSDFANAFDEQDDYFVLNTKLKYRWKNITAFLNINNLTNEEYSEYGVLSTFSSPWEEAFYPSPKINFLAGVSVEF